MVITAQTTINSRRDGWSGWQIAALFIAACRLCCFHCTKHTFGKICQHYHDSWPAWPPEPRSPSILPQRTDFPLPYDQPIQYNLPLYRLRLCHPLPSHELVFGDGRHPCPVIGIIQLSGVSRWPATCCPLPPITG